ncbi:hypothetical protein Tco_0243505 [Tanacetum coccineum]
MSSPPTTIIFIITLNQPLPYPTTRSTKATIFGFDYFAPFCCKAAKSVELQLRQRRRLQGFTHHCAPVPLKKFFSSYRRYLQKPSPIDLQNISEIQHRNYGSTTSEYSKHRLDEQLQRIKMRCIHGVQGEWEDEVGMFRLTSTYRISEAVTVMKRSFGFGCRISEIAAATKLRKFVKTRRS